MLNYIRRKLEKAKRKRTFQEYGHVINSFEVGDHGTVEYAQWLHPFESEKSITDAQVRFFETFVRRGDFVIDIGAHTGDTTVPMAVAVGQEGRVLALEPNPYVFKILARNAALNPEVGRIIPLQKAVTAEEGTFTFHYSDASFCNGGFLDKINNNRHNHNYTLEVEGIRLADHLRQHHAGDLPRLSLIKVDAEGYDKEILKTLSDLIAEYRPTLLVECYKRLDRAERADLYATIVGPGYKLFKFEDFAGGTTYRELGPEDMNRERHFEMVAVGEERMGLLKVVRG